MPYCENGWRKRPKQINSLDILENYSMFTTTICGHYSARKVMSSKKFYNDFYELNISIGYRHYCHIKPLV